MRSQIKNLLIIIIFVILLSGCATHSQYVNQSSTMNLKTVTPRYADIQNGRIQYYRFGQGSPIVLIAGYLTDVTSWDKQFLATLAEKHQLIVFNNRNVGGSSVKAEHYDSQDAARDTYQLIQQLNLKKPAILGISMGGMIAQQVAASYPNKIGQLILINTAIAGKKSIHPNADVEKLMLNMPMSKFGRYKVALKLFFPASQRTKMAFALISDRFQPQNYTEINPASVITQQRILILNWANDEATAKKIADLHLPVLVLNGTADSVIPPINSIILVDTIPHAKLQRWQDGGHAMIYQYPKSIANAVNDFIARTKGKNEPA